MTALVLPGQPLPAEFKQLQPGHGCYTSKDGVLRASVVGYPKTADGVVNVRTGRPDTSALPEIGAIVSILRLHGEAYLIHSLLRQVTGVVSQLTPQQATVTMTLVNNLPTPVSSADFVGVIRVSDVRATEKDKVKIGESFRLGDTVKAAVVSLPRSPCSLPHTDPQSTSYHSETRDHTSSQQQTNTSASSQRHQKQGTR
jgi:exosome complex component CSL4